MPQKTENMITTYMERSLHAFLKKHVCPDESMHEIKIGRHVADAFDGKTIFEIQTGNFGPLAKKIKFYLENTDYDVVIARPIAQNRKILWLDATTGEMSASPRTSSRHETVASGIADLLYIKEFFGNERVSFQFFMMEIEEVRLLDGYGKDKKKRATSVDRTAGEIFSIREIQNLDDVKAEIFPLLPNEPFSREALGKCLRLKGLKLWSAQNFLLENEILVCERVGKCMSFSKNV